MRLQKDTVLGLVFFGGLGLLGWATMTLTSLSLAPPETLSVYFGNAQRLTKGSPVYVLGKNMGHVQDVLWDPTSPSAPLRVVLEMDEKIDLRADSLIEVKDSSLLGGSQIDIDPGVAAEAAATPYRGHNIVGALDNLGKADLVGTVDSMKLFFDKLVDPEGSIGAALESREAFDDLAATLAGARHVVEQVQKGEGPLGRIIYDRSMGEDLAAAVKALREITHKLDEGTGLIARLLNDSGMADNVADALADIREITDRLRNGDGLAGRLLNDKETADNFDDALASLKSVAGKLDDPDAGLLGALVGDSKLREDADRFLANLADVTEKINEGRGLLGKMINDDQLGERLERLFTQVTGAIEDAREAAPVGTFFQVLAGPF